MMNLKDLEQVTRLREKLRHVLRQQANLTAANRLDVETGCGEELLIGYRHGSEERERGIFAAVEGQVSKILKQDEADILFELATLGVTVDPKPKTDPS